MPTKKKLTAVNMMYSDGGDQYEDIEMRHRSTRDTSATRLSTRMVMEAPPRHNLESGAEYDKAMAELLSQLPSRQIDGVAEAVARTLKAKRKSRRNTFRVPVSRELEDEIVESLQRDVDDSNKVAYDDIDATVRTMPTTLGRKRNIIHRLSSRRQKPVTKWKLMTYHLGMTWQHFKHELRKSTRLFDLWRSHLLTIEGQFGTSVLSYFIFLKWVLLINIPIFLLTFFFLVIPQILYRYYQKDPPGYHDITEFNGMELLTGDGFFEDTEMYYGFYTNDTVVIFSGSEYRMKYAYLFTCGGYYVMCLVILGYSYLHSYRKYYIEASGNMSLYYFSLVLSGWDFGIRSQEASLLKQKSLYNEFKEYLSGVSHEHPSMTKDDLAKKWLFRVLAWLVVLVLLAASGYATYILSTELSIKPQLDNESSIPVVSTLAMPVAFSSIQLVVPMIFTFLEAYEGFDRPKYELYVHMFRDMSLRTTMLAVLVFFWFEKAASEVKCWETFVGQEIYRLVIVDLIFTLGYSFFVEFLVRLLSRKFESVERSEFAIGRHTLALVYSQALCWLGVFYSPLLPVVVIIKLIIIFYVKRYSVIKNCKPSLKPWRASRTHTIFVGYLFLMFILVFIAVGCGIILVSPSKSCGPYIEYDGVYDVVHELIDEWRSKHDILSEVFGFINSPGFAAMIIIFLGMCLYYTRTIMISHRHIVRQLKIQLASEGKDKRFLMNLLNQVKLRGRRVSKHQGPNLPKTKANMSSQEMSRDADNSGGHVFVRTVAESVMSSMTK